MQEATIRDIRQYTKPSEMFWFLLSTPQLHVVFFLQTYLSDVTLKSENLRFFSIEQNQILIEA